MHAYIIKTKVVFLPICRYEIFNILFFQFLTTKKSKSKVIKNDISILIMYLCCSILSLVMLHTINCAGGNNDKFKNVKHAAPVFVVGTTDVTHKQNNFVPNMFSYKLIYIYIYRYASE